MRKIMIVDDMAIFREPVSEALQKHGYETTCASDGLEALAKVVSEEPDLILLDMTMPRLGGIQTLQQLRRSKQTQYLPVIMLTDMSDREHVAQAAELNVDGYIIKSEFSMPDLLQRIHDVI